jgi:ribose transport system substrate-binding protein
VVAKLTGERMGLDLQVLQADDDSITQGQQLLKIIQSPAESWPSAFIVEPASATGMRRVAEMAVTAGIAWVVSNSDVDYIEPLRKKPQVPVFIVTQGQREIGQLQGKQIAALLPRGGSVLYIEGPSMSSVAVQRREGMDSTKPPNVKITTIRSIWSEEGAYQSTATWLRMVPASAGKFDLVAGQTHELALGARKAFQKIENQEQQKKWLGMPYIGIGISNQVKSLVSGDVLTAAVITSVTMDVALKMVVHAIETKEQPPERNVVDTSSYPELDKLTAKR